MLKVISCFVIIFCMLCVSVATVEPEPFEKENGDDVGIIDEAIALPPAVPAQDF